MPLTDGDAPALLLGPLLRHVDPVSATVWVETDRPCTVDVLGRSTRTFHVGGHCYALLVVEGLEPGSTTPYEVHLDDRLVIRASAGEFVERHGTRSSYTYQLEAFVRAVREGAPLPVDVDDAVANMRLIDACYVAAGLQPRPRMDRTAVPGATSAR